MVKKIQDMDVVIINRFHSASVATDRKLHTSVNSARRIVVDFVELCYLNFACVCRWRKAFPDMPVNVALLVEGGYGHSSKGFCDAVHEAKQEQWLYIHSFTLMTACDVQHYEGSVLYALSF